MRVARLAQRLGLGVVIVAATGCAPALRQPTAADVLAAGRRWPGTTVGDLQRGRTLYVRRCAGCHTLHLPSEYRSESWPSLVESMSQKARLTPGQEHDIARFLVTLSEVQVR